MIHREGEYWFTPREVGLLAMKIAEKADIELPIIHFTKLDVFKKTISHQKLKTVTNPDHFNAITLCKSNTGEVAIVFFLIKGFVRVRTTLHELIHWVRFSLRLVKLSEDLRSEERYVWKRVEHIMKTVSYSSSRICPLTS